MATREDVVASLRKLNETLDGLLVEMRAEAVSLKRLNALVALHRYLPDPDEEAAFLAEQKRRDEQPEV